LRVGWREDWLLTFDVSPGCIHPGLSGVRARLAWGAGA
jgi:hypothetical protein